MYDARPASHSDIFTPVEGGEGAERLVEEIGTTTCRSAVVGVWTFTNDSRCACPITMCSPSGVTSMHVTDVNARRLCVAQGSIIKTASGAPEAAMTWKYRT